MNSRKILLVEDDEVTLTRTKEILNNRGWVVETAQDGRQALDYIRDRASSYDVIVLDLKLDRLTSSLNGEEVLEQIKNENIQAPPIIILSGYLENTTVQKCRFLGAAHVLKKPYDPVDLDHIATVIAKKVPITNLDIEFNESLLDYMVKRRESSLKEMLIKSSQTDFRIIPPEEPILVVGRRWNSWYPSVFPVPGGAYAVLGPPRCDQTESPPKNSPSVVIDPGFRFLEVFREIGISWGAIDYCVITHNHPDHIGGIFELMAARHALGKKTRIFCSGSCERMLNDYSGFNLEIKVLDDNQKDLFPPYETSNQWLRLKIRGFDTAHEEIGSKDTSKGLCISYEAGSSSNALDAISELVILGDTEYDRSQHKNKWIPILCKSNVKVVVLHIGCSQFRRITGKHLYLPGLRNILTDMESGLSESQYRGRQLVLVSEWGLEHATKRQIMKLFGQNLSGFDDYSPIVETIEYLQKDLQKILLIPADVGLAVGIKTGKVYFEKKAISPEDVDVVVTEKGLSYKKRTD